MTVRADINGRYSNRMYAYEPSDIKICKWPIVSFTQIYAQGLTLWNRLIECKFFLPLTQCWAIWRRLRSSLSLSCDDEDKIFIPVLILIQNLWSPEAQTRCCPHSLYMESLELKHSTFHPLLKSSLIEFLSWFLPLFFLVYMKNVFWINIELFIQTRCLVCHFLILYFDKHHSLCIRNQIYCSQDHMSSPQSIVHLAVLSSWNSVSYFDNFNIFERKRSVFPKQKYK